VRNRNIVLYGPDAAVELVFLNVCKQNAGKHSDAKHRYADDIKHLSERYFLLLLQLIKAFALALGATFKPLPVSGRSLGAAELLV
jgi:hypothetical protein